MRELFVAIGKKGTLPDSEKEWLMAQAERVEKQGVLARRADCVGLCLRSGAFAGATLVTLLGAALFSLQKAFWFHLLAGLGLLLGFVGVGGLIFGTANLFQATQLSMASIRQEAGLIRARQKNTIAYSI